MNCNIYLNEGLYKEIEDYKKAHNRSRNSIITEAIRNWLSIHKNKQWPKSLFDFPEETKNLYPDISELRKELLYPIDVKF